MLDYGLLEAFSSVIESGGFERAGERLGLSQSAVSQRIKLLEEEIGSVLVIRDNPPRPSPAGERLLRHCRQVSRLEAQALEEIGSGRGDGRFESLPVAVNADSLATWFVDAALPCLRRWETTIDIRVADQDKTLRLLKSGEVAGCLSAQEKSLVGCVASRLGAMEYRLCASPSFVRRWFPSGFSSRAAAEAPIIHYNRDDSLQTKALERCFGPAAPVPPAYYIPSTERIFDMVCGGVGYCMIPLVQASQALERGKLVELRREARTSVGLYWHRWETAPKGLLDFSRALEEEASKRLSK